MNLSNREVVEVGEHLGYTFEVVRRGPILNIALAEDDAKSLIELGADMSILINIGEDDPYEVIEELYKSIPEKE